MRMKPGGRGREEEWTGSIRTIKPKREPGLTTEWDKEAGALRDWYFGPDGEKVLLELS